MIKSLAAIFLFSQLFVWQADAQVRRSKRAPRPTVRPASASLPAFPGYEFFVEIAADRSFTIRVVTGYESPQLDQASLKKALDEYSSMQSPKMGQIPAGPRVFVRAAPTLDLKTVIQCLRTARGGASELSLETSEGVELRIPPEPKPASELSVMPNPLTLVAAFDDKGAITLNREPHGSLPDVSKIGLRLKEIFRAREENGVFRENTNEIEKTVTIKVPPTARYSDLAAFAKGLHDAGADPLWLQIDDLEAPEKRLELIDLGTVTIPQPNPKRRPQE